MKWQCQCWRPVNDTIEPRQRCDSAIAAGVLTAFNSRMRPQVAWAISRIDTVPQAMWGDSRELESNAVTGLDIW